MTCVRKAAATVAVAVTLVASLLVLRPAPVAAATASSAVRPAATSVLAQPVLRYGARGSAVVTLQRRLAALRYDAGPVDGVFGYSTLHAVVAFQKVNRLARDGVVGPLTWAALARPYVPWPRHTSSVYSVEVDLARQVAYLVRYGAVQRILDASTGSGQLYRSGGAWHRAVTPVGEFRVYRRYNGWETGPLGSLWRPNYFTGGYAVHGSTSVPAYPASHGCVRVTVPAMDRLWGLLTIGTRVSLYRT